MKFETKAIRLGHTPDPKSRAVIPPIHQGTTFQFTAVGENTGYEYSRTSNPTRVLLEECLAGLEGGEFGIAFGSGMAATDAVLAMLKPGDEVVSARNLYGGTLRLFESIYTPRNVKFVYIDGGGPEAWRAAVTKRTKMLWLETPTNPQLQVFDIAAIAEVAHQAGVPLLVDNTFASPYIQRPLALGADIVLHSTSKYINGHNDVIGGAVITSDPQVEEAVRFFQNTAGAVPGPWDCYLTLRGIKTLALRMRQHNANALAVARFLEGHEMVDHVYYPGLEGHPQHELAKRQMDGSGGMVTFHLAGGLEQVNAFVGALSVFHFAESLGGAESLVCHPASMSHAVLSDEERAHAGIRENMIRLSVGLEHVDDLIADLEQALHAARQSRQAVRAGG